MALITRGNNMRLLRGGRVQAMIMPGKPRDDTPPQPVFSPADLFAAGEQGVWYDPSDFSTMFQDSAGTTPVTAVEQPVGLILDKSGRGNHASQSTTNATPSMPILRQDAAGRYYLAFDGTDDWLETGSINFSATNKLSVFAGIRTNVAITQIFFETSANLNTNNGAFAFLNNGPTDLYIRSKGTTVADVIKSYPIQTQYVISQVADISAPFNRVNVNGLLAGNVTTTQGTGNYGNHPLYIGRRAGTMLTLNGRIYSLIIRGAMTNSPQLEQTELWVAEKTGVTL